jgi:hypothetical protein
MGKELGSAGCDPFSEAVTVPEVHNNEYIKGSHGAAIKENNWDELARFAVHNDIPPETTEEYQATPLGAFQGWKGWCVCLGMWAVLLFLGAYWFPRAALLSPKLFWGGGLSFILVAILFIAAIHPFIRGKQYSTRKKLQKISLRIMFGALVCVLILWTIIPLLDQQTIKDATTGIAQGRWQMCSMVAYFTALWNILTKV